MAVHQKSYNIKLVNLVIFLYLMLHFGHKIPLPQKRNTVNLLSAINACHPFMVRVFNISMYCLFFKMLRI